MSISLYLRRIRAVAALVDLVDRLLMEVADVRRLDHCPHCGFKTTIVHDNRRLGCVTCPPWLGYDAGVGAPPILM